MADQIDDGEELFGTSQEPVAPKTERKSRAPKVAAEDEARLHPVLSNEDVIAARAAAKARIEKEQRAKYLLAIEEEEVRRLRVEEGMTTGVEEKDQIVKVTMDLAPHSDAIRINGNEYWHGWTYDVPRHVADSLREISARGWRHQWEIEGKTLTEAYQMTRETVLSPLKVVNAPAAIGVNDQGRSAH